MWTLFIFVSYKSAHTHKCTVLCLYSPSACSYPWAKPYQPQSYWHSGVLAASHCQAKSWTCLCLPPVFPHCCWWTGEHGRAACKRWELYPVPAPGPAAWHHLPAAYRGVYPRGLEPAVGLELSPHTQNLQSHRWGHTYSIMLVNNKEYINVDMFSRKTNSLKFSL